MNPITIAAATTRLTELVVKDEVSSPIRYTIEDWAKDAPMYSFRERMSYLVSCPRCVSIWAAGVVLGLSYLGLPGRTLIRMLALSHVTITTIGLTGKAFGDD